MPVTQIGNRGFENMNPHQSKAQESEKDEKHKSRRLVEKSESERNPIENETEREETLAALRPFTHLGNRLDLTA